MTRTISVVRAKNQMDTGQFFKQNLLEHYHHPKNVGTLNEPDFSYTEYNHSCGDQVQIEGRIHDGVLVELSFVGSGCMLSQAVASMITESCKGKTVHDIVALDKNFVINLIGIELGPTRLRCALLALYALQHGVLAYCKELEEQ